MTGNPFTPSFGSEPLVLAGRARIIEDVIAGLENRPGDPNRSTLFTGPRGSGKTVLLAKIADDARQHGWVAARTTAVPGMPERLLEQIQQAGAEYLSPPARSHITGISVQGTGLTRERVSREATWGQRFTALVDELNSKSVGLLIAIDEVSANAPGMVELATEYQQMVTDRRDVALIMAGLPGHISRLLRDDSISFLRRAFQHKLDSVTVQDAEVALEQTITISGRKISADAVRSAAEFSQGFPFLIQLVGYNLWRQSPERESISMADAQNAMKISRGDMNRMILENTIHEISRKDLQFLCAMTSDGDSSSMRDIAARMGATTSLAGKYRLRLLEQGLISEAGYGRVRFELPLLREYLQENYPAPTEG